MASVKSCKVKLLNNYYDIKCPEGEEDHLLLAADKLNEKLITNKNKFSSLDPFQILLLAALDISHELILCKNDQEKQWLQVTQFITSLESKINKTAREEP